MTDRTYLHKESQDGKHGTCHSGGGHTKKGAHSSEWDRIALATILIRLEESCFHRLLLPPCILSTASIVDTTSKAKLSQVRRGFQAHVKFLAKAFFRLRGHGSYLLEPLEDYNILGSILRKTCRSRSSVETPT